MMLSLDTAYRSFGGEVEASITPTICRLPDSRRHQLSAIARRPRLEWYDDFTALLVEIAAVAGVEPTLNKDRDSGAPYGWLLDAAQSLETFLDPQMRSPDEGFCFKRLERAQAVLERRHLQNPPTA